MKDFKVTKNQEPILTKMDCPFCAGTGKEIDYEDWQFLDEDCGACHGLKVVFTSYEDGEWTPAHLHFSVPFQYTNDDGTPDGPPEPYPPYIGPPSPGVWAIVKVADADE